jgi:hypothetical protein
MLALNRNTPGLPVINFQARLMPATEDSAGVTTNARRLLDRAELLRVPILFTEQNAQGLGSTIPAADLNLGIQVIIDGGATTTPDRISIDTTQPGTHTILHVATD